MSDVDVLIEQSDAVRRHMTASNLARYLQGADVRELAAFVDALQAEASARGIQVVSLLGSVAARLKAIADLEDAV